MSPITDPVDPLQSFLDYLEGVKKRPLYEVLGMAEAIIHDPEMLAKRREFLNNLRCSADESMKEDLSGLIHSSGTPLPVDDREIKILIRYGFVDSSVEGLVRGEKVLQAMHHPTFLEMFPLRIAATPGQERALCWR